MIFFSEHGTSTKDMFEGLRHRLARSGARFFFISPWLMTTAVVILFVIVLIFAANNLQREKRLLTDSLIQKGQTVIRFVGAGARATMHMRREADGGSGHLLRIAHLQQIIDQATQEPDIRSIVIVGENRVVVAHSDHAQIGRLFQGDIGCGAVSSLGNQFPPVRSHVVTQPGGGRVFEVLASFTPFPGRRHFMGRHNEPQGFGMCDIASPESAPKVEERAAPLRKMSIVVGLDMKELDTAVRGHQLHIAGLSLALLFIGIGGWLSVIFFQGYRVSRETLNRIQAFTDLLISRLPVGIIATDEEGMIRSFNQAATDMTGLVASSALGTPPAALLPDGLASMLAAGKNGARSEEERDMTLESTTGPPRELQVYSSSIVDRDGGCVGRVLLLTDMTEIKNLEALVRRRDRLAALGKMAAGVAHEIRNPLSSIKGFATLLGSHFAAESEEKKTAALLVAEVERLNRSVTELLNYTRPTQLNYRELNLARLLEDSLTLIASDALSAGVELSLSLSPELQDDRSIWLDHDRINQVLLNVYLNALQAMNNGGSLTVSAWLTEDKKHAVIEVRDTGSGISEEELEKVTDPYYTTKADGTGLGLAIVSKIVEEHGGVLEIKSSPGTGTTLRLYLSITDPGLRKQEKDDAGG